MTRVWCLGWISLGLLLSPQVLFAASMIEAVEDSVQETVEVRVRVLWVRDIQVRIDLGSQSGLKLGDRVRLEPLGRPNVEATVTELSDLEATVTLVQSDPSIVPGVAGRVRVVPPTLVDVVKQPTRPPIVWSEETEHWEDNMPLLGEIKPSEPKERDPVWTGRLELSAHSFRDATGSTRTDQQWLVRTGWVGTNPFGHGGEVQLQMDYQASSLSVGDSAVGVSDDSDSYVRLQRASYTLGGTRFDARRIEVGRFFSRWFPELGILDGAEVSERFEDGTRVGVSAGFQPGFKADLPFTNDLALSAFWDRVLGANGRSNLGAAVQTTWYDGSSDRQWFLMKGRYAEREGWVTDAALEGDFYGSEDIGKGSGLELTQKRARVQRRFAKEGALAVYFSDQRWPETKRGLPVIQNPDFLFQARTRRLGVDGWWDTSEVNQIDARLERWEDEDSSGSLGELGYDQDLQGDTLTSWRISGYWSDTDLADIRALRFSLAGRAPVGQWDTSLELGKFDILDQFGVSAAHSKGVLRGQWSGAVGRDWSLLLHGALYFGGDQDAYSMGISLLRSF